MSPTARTAWPRIAGFLAAFTACATGALAQEPDADSAAALRERYAALSQELEDSTLQKGLYLESVERSRALSGDVYAIVEYPFATVAEAFSQPANWCEALILHLNVHYCRADPGDEGTVLSVAVGKKIDQPLNDTHRIKLTYNVAASGVDFMRVELGARKGPLGTRDYFIALELIALPDERSFIHIHYAYRQGLRARMATGVYFGSSGQHKVGFTLIDADQKRPAHLVDGLRGAVERNTMRYYLAIDAYLHSFGSPPPQRFEESLERWFASTERFALQLHEVEHDDYIALKRRQYLRQQSAF